MRRFTALVNPISGGGRATAVWRPVLKRLTGAAATVKTVTTTGRAHALDQACAAATRGHVVVAVGGDGLVRDVAGGVHAAGGVMGIVPAGRGNDLANLLRIPSDPAAVATMLLNAPTKPIDLIEVNGVHVPGNVYIGIDSLATRIINGNRWAPPRLLYRLAPVAAILRWRPARYTLVDDTGRRTVTGHTVVVANSGVYGHGLSIVPPARLDDGRLHVMTVGDLPRREVVSFMRQAKTGHHLDRDGVEVHATTELTVHADRPVPVCADGDEVTELPAVIRSHRHAISVIAPV